MRYCAVVYSMVYGSLQHLSPDSHLVGNVLAEEHYSLNLLCMLHFSSYTKVI